MSADETGTVPCRQYTRGRRAPITVMRSMPFVGDLVGRQDLAAYIVAAPFFFGAVVTRGLWWPFLRANYGLTTAALVALILFLVVPFAAGYIASIVGLRARDLPRHAMTVAALTPRVNRGPITATGRINRHRAIRITGAQAHAWVIDPPKHTETRGPS